MYFIRILPLVFAFLAAAAMAAPRFEEFATAASYQGKAAEVKLTGKKSRQYASVLRAAAQRPPNFAGRYVLAAWGCGASCVMGAAIDAKTGIVAWLPFTVCCWDMSVTEPLEFRPDSRLLIVHGSRDEKGSGSAVNYYVFDGRKFAPISGQP